MNFPILSSLILLPTIGALFLLFSKDKNSNTGKYVALFTSFVNFLISIYLWYLFDPSTSSFQFVENREWLKGFVNYKVGIDGISILFIILTTFITRWFSPVIGCQCCVLLIVVLISFIICTPKKY